MKLLNSSFLMWIKYKTKNLNFATKIILSILIVIFLWMLTGLFKRDEVEPSKSQNICVNVNAKHSVAQDRKLSIILNGYTKAFKKVDIQPEVDGNLVEIYVKNGQYLNEGDPIVKIEVENKNYQLTQAKAVLSKQQFNFEAIKKLFDKKLSSESALKEAQANLKEAEASYNQAKLQLDKTIVKAPFNGYIDEILLQQGSFNNINLSTVFAQFSSIDPLSVISFIPQNYIDFIKDACDVKIIGVNNKVVEGKVSFVSKVSNPSTRTFQIEALIPNKDEKFHIGESVKIQIFFDETKKLHKIPKSALVLDTQGALCVKTVDDLNHVKSMPIEILDEDDTSFWVNGLPDSANIITLGQNYVKNYEKVIVNYK